MTIYIWLHENSSIGLQNVNLQANSIIMMISLGSFEIGLQVCNESTASGLKRLCQPATLFERTIIRVVKCCFLFFKSVKTRYYPKGTSPLALRARSEGCFLENQDLLFNKTCFFLFKPLKRKKEKTATKGFAGDKHQDTHEPPNFTANL